MGCDIFVYLIFHKTVGFRKCLFVCVTVRGSGIREELPSILTFQGASDGIIPIMFAIVVTRHSTLLSVVKNEKETRICCAKKVNHIYRPIQFFIDPSTFACES